MINANRYLKRRVGKGRSGERWYLQVPTPADLRARFGWTIERALNTSDPRVAHIRRDELLGEIRAMFASARAEPKLEDVLGAIRRAELARAHANWSEMVAERGVAAARQTFAVLLDDADDVADGWQRRARHALLNHGLAPTDDAIERTAEALLEAHVEGADWRSTGGPQYRRWRWNARDVLRVLRLKRSSPLTSCWPIGGASAGRSSARSSTSDGRSVVSPSMSAMRMALA